jgi:hypothetical protein
MPSLRMNSLLAPGHPSLGHAASKTFLFNTALLTLATLFFTLEQTSPLSVALSKTPRVSASLATKWEPQFLYVVPITSVITSPVPIHSTHTTENP